MEQKPLIPLGAKIKVDKSKIENLFPNKFLDNLPQMIKGEVVDYKMTDGMEIGYVLRTENNQKIWIFKTELNEETVNKYETAEITTSKDLETNALFMGKYNIAYEINGNRNIKTILNPINFFSWLILTLKDIF